MDNVQLENGYTAIAHEILEKMAQVKLSPTQYRIIFVVWRFTYGFRRKEHSLSLSFIAKATGCDKRQVQREISKLIKDRFLIQKSVKGVRVIRFNKHYSQWFKGLPVGEIDNGETVNGETAVGESVAAPVGEIDNPPVGEIDNQENYIYKTNIKTIYTTAFEKFYFKYPRPEDKNRSFTNWKTQLKTYTVEQLMTACNNYKKAKAGTEKQYLKSSANFLGKERPFEDYLQVQPEPQSKYVDRTNYKPGE
jgi:phage replication O-like protein O